MNKYKLVEKIEQLAPLCTAEPWDCVGFMAETPKTDIHKIMLCLTVTQNVINQAFEANCDMIISHHPMFEIKCLKPLVSDLYTPRIDIYSAHTNLDLAKGGTTDSLIAALGYKNPCEIYDFLRIVELETEISIEDFSKKLSEVSKDVRLVNNNGIKTLKRIAFCAGSGSEFIEEAQKHNADALVTGDLKFHTALEAGIAVYDIGHFESEILVLKSLKRRLEPDVEIIMAKEESPFIRIN